MRIEIEEKEKATVVKLEGDLDYNSYIGFNDKVQALLDNKTPKIIIDLGSVGHIDSMGLGTLTKLWKHGGQAGTTIVLCSVPKNVGKLIKLINLDNRISIFETLEDALV